MVPIRMLVQHKLKHLKGMNPWFLSSDHKVRYYLINIYPTVSPWASLKVFWGALDLALFDQALEHFLEVKHIRIDRFKICLNSATGSVVTIHSYYQLKICVSFVFLLYNQLCAFLAYDYVQTKDNQNGNYLERKIQYK